MQKGSDVNARDDSAATVLMSAIWVKDPVRVEMLIKAGANANAKDEQELMVLDLVDVGNERVTGKDIQACRRLLLEAGAVNSFRDHQPEGGKKRITGQDLSLT